MYEARRRMFEPGVCGAGGAHDVRCFAPGAGLVRYDANDSVKSPEKETKRAFKLLYCKGYADQGEGAWRLDLDLDHVLRVPPRGRAVRELESADDE